MLGEEEKSKLTQKYGTEVFSCTSLKWTSLTRPKVMFSLDKTSSQDINKVALSHVLPFQCNIKCN
jgi:hypothetical protein